MDDARKAASAFQKTMRDLGEVLKKLNQPGKAEELYRRSLSELNRFFLVCNAARSEGWHRIRATQEAGGAKQQDAPLRQSLLSAF